MAAQNRHVHPVFTDRQRAESFGSVAANYDRYRPTYPAALIDDLVALEPRTVLDLGCGTGKASVLLTARGLDVLGVEIDPQMAELARSHGITVEVSPFEQWDSAGRRFDLMVSGQAWHWVDPALGVPKAAEVVRPGGTVALFWNDDTLDETTMAALNTVYDRYAPALRDATAPCEPDELVPYADPFEQSPSFDTVETRTYGWQRDYTADEWVALCLTHSNHLILPEDQRAALADGLRAAVTELGGITADYETYAVFAHRAA